MLAQAARGGFEQFTTSLEALVMGTRSDPEHPLHRGIDVDLLAFAAIETALGAAAAIQRVVAPPEYDGVDLVAMFLEEVVAEYQR